MDATHSIVECKPNGSKRHVRTACGIELDLDAKTDFVEAGLTAWHSRVTCAACLPDETGHAV